MSELDTSVRENPLVAKIVNQEIRRRRRLIWLYMGLLLVPLLSALGFLVYGRSDRELIHLEVATEARSQREKMAVLQNQVNDLQVQVQQLSRPSTQVLRLAQILHHQVRQQGELHTRSSRARRPTRLGYLQ